MAIQQNCVQLTYNSETYIFSHYHGIRGTQIVIRHVFHDIEPNLHYLQIIVNNTFIVTPKGYTMGRRNKVIRCSQWLTIYVSNIAKMDRKLRKRIAAT